jgi:hypothetical protein
MTRIFEVKTTCAAQNGGAHIESVYRVSALNAERAILKAKKCKGYELSAERIMSVTLLASTD